MCVYNIGEIVGLRMTHVEGVYEPLSRASSTLYRHDAITLPSQVPGIPESRRADLLRQLNTLQEARRNTYLRTQGILVDFAPLKELIQNNDRSLLERTLNPEAVDDKDTTSKADELLYYWIHSQRYLNR